MHHRAADCPPEAGKPRHKPAVGKAETAGQFQPVGKKTEEVLNIYCNLIDELGLDATWSTYSTNPARETKDWGWDRYGSGFMLSDHGIPAILASGLKTLENVRNCSIADLLERHDFQMLDYMV
ncbi:MAG: hypothetical protein AB3N24_24105, partial [Leisingera sp.]